MKILKNLILCMGLIGFSASAAIHSVKKEPFEDGVYIIDGDIPVYDLDELERITAKDHSKLIMNMLMGSVLDLWNRKSQSDLTFCVSDDFKERKEDVVDAILNASKSWMESANIQFKYIKEQDFNCDQHNDVVMFDVRPVNTGMYLARAFFPSSPRRHRNIMVDDSAFNFSQTTLEGIMAHELGHTMGFRHEHIHQDATDKCQENDSFRPLTSYDPFSVMHYPHCDGQGNILDLGLTALDREGASIAYPF